MLKLKDIRKMVDAGELYLHHTSWRRGYLSRTCDEENNIAEPYSGRFGEGYTVGTCSYDSSQYYHLSYYIKVK